MIRAALVPWMRDTVEQAPNVFQQDNCSVHWTAEVRRELASVSHLARGTWPPKSPDLSPIESVWAVMASKVRRATCGRGKITREEYRHAIWVAWNEVRSNLALLQRMYDRCWERVEYAAGHGGHVQ